MIKFKFVLVLFLSGMVGHSVFGFGTGEKSSSTFESSLESPKSGEGELVPNKIVIKFNNGRSFGKQVSKTGTASLDNLFKAHNIFRLEQLAKSKTQLKKGRSSVAMASLYYAYFSGAASPLSVAQAFSNHPMIEYAEPVYLHRLLVDPNDPLFNQQINMIIIQAREAWDVIKGEQGNPRAVVAVVDGGTDIDHGDLAANIWVNPDEIANNNIDDDNNGKVDDVHGWNFANDSNDPSGLPATPINANHGSHVAGIACAVTNNANAVAGISWNATLMPINVSHPTRDTTLAFGFEGIIYAAEEGADIISLSWGRLGTPSRSEQDVITFAADLGAVIVAAAGNSETDRPHFPSAYNNVFSVASTRSDDVKSRFSNYGKLVDIAAPGENVRSTFHNGVTGIFSGTSQATPLVAGVIALVKTQHPDWLGIQAVEQVRITADNIDAVNPNFVGLLGRGRLNAFRAVTDTTTPSIRIAEVSFTETNGDGAIQAGESVQLAVRIVNYLAPASNISLNLVENDPFINFTPNPVNIASLGTLEETTIAFTFTVSSVAPSGRSLNFVLNISSTTYQEQDRFSLIIESPFGNLTINNVDVSLTNIGRIGFADPDNSLGGIGFKFNNGPNLLFEGGILAGTGPTTISNSVRGVLIGQNLTFDDDFAGTDDGDLRINTPGAITAQESFAAFKDTKSNTPMNLRITQESFAANQAPNDGLILLRYTIENQGQNALQNFHFGFFFDWDIDSDNPANVSENLAGYDAARRLGHVSFSPTFVGASFVSTTSNISFRAIDNSGTNFAVNDGFTDAEKWQTISGGIQVTSIGPADVSHVIATGPFTIQPNNFVQVGIALLAGVGLPDLQANADAAQAFWNSLFVSAVEEPPSPIPTKFALNQNYPNPFNPSTEIRYELARGGSVELAVYNLLGQKIRALVNQNQPAGVYSVPWDGKDDFGRAAASGVYLYQLTAGAFKETRKMLLLK